MITLARTSIAEKGVAVPTQTPAGRRPAASTIRHGQASCADYGCTRAMCRAAARKARRDRDRDRADGLPARVDATHAATYTHQLQDLGMSAQDIADAAGVAATLIRRLLRTSERRPARISRTTQDAVLGVPIPHRTRRPRPYTGRGLIDAATAAACLTDLAEGGWPASHLAARLRINPRTVAAIRDGRHTRTTIALSQRVARLHRELAGTNPTGAGVRAADAARTRAWAARRALGTDSLRPSQLTVAA